MKKGATKMENPNDRFIYVYQQQKGVFSPEAGIKIIVDRATGVQYLWHASQAAHTGMGGLTVLVDQNGKPLLYQPPKG